MAFSQIYKVVTTTDRILHIARDCKAPFETFAPVKLSSDFELEHEHLDVG